MIYKFNNIVNVKRATKCQICETYIYTLPIPVEPVFVDFIKPIGLLKYPLEATQLVKIDNENVYLTARINRSYFDIKYKKDVEMYKRLFDAMVAAYVMHIQNIEIEML